MAKAREWRVLDGDTERLQASLVAAQLIGEFLGGKVEITSPQDADPVAVPDGDVIEQAHAWLFLWTGREGVKPHWTVPIEDDETLERSFMAVDLVTEFLGGAFTVAGIRAEQDNDYVTTGRMFVWQSFVPAVRAPEQSGNGVAEPVPTG